MALMSFLKNLFGGSAPKPTTTTASQGLEALEEKAELLRKRIAHLQSQIEEQEKIARQNATTNKPKALAALKKKKQLEERVKHSEGTLENIETQKDMLESASSNAAVLKTMADTTKIVKQQQDNLDINKVEDIVDEMREQREVAQEITNALSQQITQPHDEDELLKELESMQREDLDAKLLQTDKNRAALPDVPTELPAQPSPSKKKEEDELDELKKWASAAQ